jgi:diguanylate cyclase (GGDEF)-like protein
LLAADPRPAAALDPARPIDSYAIETWATEDGLPHNLVHAVAQTPDGYLWFGSWEGLVRFNAWEFRVFDAEHDGVLANNGVRALALGADGALWVGTSEGGLTRLHQGRWRKYGAAEGLAVSAVRSLAAARDGRVWIGTEESGVVVLENERVRPLDGALPHALVLSLAESRDGTIWIGTLRGLARWRAGKLDSLPSLPDGTAPAVYAIHEDSRDIVRVATQRGLYRVAGDALVLDVADEPLASDSISAIVEDRDGNLWVGTVQSGLARVRDGRAELMTARDGLPHDRVAALLEDAEGNIWVGTGVGLARLGDAPFISLGPRRGLSDAYVRTVTEDRAGTLWVGTNNGLNRLVDGRFEAFYPAGEGGGRSIMTLYPAADGALWIGTRDGGVARYDGRTFVFTTTADGLASNQVRALRETRDGSLWIGTSSGLSRLHDGRVESYDHDDGLPRSYVMAVYEDGAGRLWAGTSDGAAVLDGERFRAFDASTGAPDSNVFDFLEDGDGSLWLATSDGLYRHRDGRFTAIRGRPGDLPHQVFGLLADDAGHLWVSSNSGVYRLVRADLDAVADGRAERFASVRYGGRDGMASSQCNGSSQPAAWRTRDGMLWFATAGGAAAVDPTRAEVGAVRPPPTVVERVLIDGEPPAALDAFTVPPDARRITFEYAALAYRRPEHVDYRFRLVGFESDWVPVGARRATVFTNLPPGEYRFEVEPDAEFPGQPHPRARVAFRVLPHFWETIWFYAMVVLAGLAAVLLVYRLRVTGLLRRERELARLVTERTEALAEETRKLQLANQQKNELLAKVQHQAEAFERLSREDSLTGLPNRRHFDALMREAFARSRREGQPLSVAVLDLDHFKRINDRHAHAVGDEALRTVADLIRETCSGSGIAARYGGEEFVIAFPGLDLAAASTHCESLRGAVERHDWTRLAPGLHVTISIGVANDADAATHERLIALADERLYRAKNAGRNRVVA